jgi:hypothetical protein
MAKPDERVEIIGLGLASDKPRPNTKIDLGSLVLSPTQGFVLSRVDGQVSYADICQLTGLGREATLGILRQLKAQGLILGPVQYGQDAAPPKTSPNKTAPPTERPSTLERVDDGSAVNAGELVDWPDGAPELKARIVRLHRRLRQVPPHELLGVAVDADAVTVKRAFALACKELHPDRYFGKDLGAFKPKLAAIFARLTEAVQEMEAARKSRR